MVQMVGVIVLSLGLPQMFASIDHGDTLDHGVMVAGYVIMRVALLFLWWQVSRHDPARRASRALVHDDARRSPRWAGSLLAIADLPVATTFALYLVLIALELAGPFFAERKGRTPWHPHHIAERYGLLVIITLGEVILGTVAALNAVVHGEAGWTIEAALLAVAGVGLTFGCWWMYFAAAVGEPLVRHRERGFAFGYGHLAIFGSLAAMGGGLHVAAYGLEGEAEIGADGDRAERGDPGRDLRAHALRGVLAADARARPVPSRPARGHRPRLLLAVVLAAAGASVTVCLLVLMLAPVVTVVGYETLGHRHVAEALERL